jgi:PEP-CTERM motif
MPIHHRLYSMAAAALAAALILPGGASSAPVDLYGGSVSPDGGSISGTLHGNLSGNVLALNSTAPRSDLTIVPGSTPLSPPLITETFRLHTGVFGIEFPAVDLSLHLTPSTHPNRPSTITLLPWRFAVGGTMDFNAGTAGLTLTPGPDFFIHAQLAYETSYSAAILPGLGPLEQAAAEATRAAALAVLSLWKPEIDIDAHGWWTSVTPGAASAALIEDEPVMQIDLGLTDWHLVGEIDVDVEVDSVPEFLSALEGTLENTIDDALRRAISGIHTGAPGGFEVDCHFNVTCDFSAQLSYFGEGAVAEVPEPAALGLLGSGLAALALARRRRKV